MRRVSPLIVTLDPPRPRAPRRFASRCIPMRWPAGDRTLRCSSPCGSACGKRVYPPKPT